VLRCKKSWHSDCLLITETTFSKVSILPLAQLPKVGLFFTCPKWLLAGYNEALAAQKLTTMKWTDTQRIAEELYDQHEDIDPKTIRFTDLMQWVMALDGFDDIEAHCGEKVLEAIQLAWIEEAE